MKKITFIVSIFITTISFGQNFEGTLSYSYDIELSIEMKETGLTKEILMKKMKEENSFSSQINYSYKENNYLVEMIDNGTISKYIGEKHTIYTREKDDDLIVASDASIDLENLMFGTSPKIEKKETDVIILGQKCDKVVITCETVIYEYYYNSEFLKMNPELYKNHKYEMWFEFLNISKSLPLRIIKKFKELVTIKMDLIDYNKNEISSENFKLPKMKLDRKLTKYVLSKNQKIYRVK